MRLLRLLNAPASVRVKPVEHVRRRTKEEEDRDLNDRRRRHRMRNLHLPPDPDEPIGSRVDVTV